MTSSPIISWQIECEKMEIVTDFLFLGSEITEEDYHSHEIRRQFLFIRKATTNLDSMLKSWDITLPTDVHIVESVVFPVVTYLWDLDHKEGRVPKN